MRRFPPWAAGAVFLLLADDACAKHSRWQITFFELRDSRPYDITILMEGSQPAAAE